MRHKRVRFRREEICNLDSLPSAVGQAVPRASRLLRRRPSRGWLRLLARTLGVIVVAFLVISAAAYGIASSSLGSEKLRAEAENALRRAVGPQATASIGPASIAFDGARVLALDFSNLQVASGGVPGIEAGSLRFGIRMLPLLHGDLKLGSARISDARISLPALKLKGGGDWTTDLRNEDGLIDPDLVGLALFKSLHNALGALERAGTQRIDLENTELVIAEQGRIRSLRIAEASLSDSGNGELSLSATASLDGRQIELSATARHDGPDDAISDLALTLSVAPSGAPVVNEAGLVSVDSGKSTLGSAEIKITGAEGVEGNPPKLVIAANLVGSLLDFGKRGFLVGDIDLDATLQVGANKLEFDRLVLATGRSRFQMTGALGPEPRTSDAAQKPTYRYEFVTDRSVLAPVDSPEAAITLAARMAGRFDEAAMKLTADHLAIKTEQGQILGVASAEFVPGKFPGLALALSTNEMPVAQAKQFWPWISAGKARQWALLNFFGGRIVEGQLRYRVAPGRLGNGVPLNNDEISGRFEVEGSRFDTTGSLPPIRDAKGVVAFQGNDVDITLESGTAFVPSGKPITVSNGTMALRNTNLPPVIGDLELDIAGEASAVAELAELKPIDALRRIDLTPGDFTGDVSGHVKSQVPLQKDADLRSIEWQVALDFTNLAVAQPFDGQKVTAAKGRILLDPRHADIQADAQMNGIPAKLNIVEPFRDDGPVRLRDIALTIDDKRRNQMAPGLDGLVSGSLVLKVDASGKGGPRKIKADLAKATLTLPWIGWSKGSGVPASLSFAMAQDGGAATLSDFDLVGQSFELSGTVRLQDGGLSSAKFTTVRFNRGDNVQMSIDRQGKSYAVSVDGESFDARSLIKLVLGGGKGDGKAGGSAAVSLTASIARIAGFNDETLSNVKLTYKSGSGSAYALSGATDRGGAVTIGSDSDGTQDVMRVQSADAGSLVRFLDLYDYMQGGQVDLTLRGKSGGEMRGRFAASDFLIVGEPRLGSIVSTTPAGSDRNLNQAVNRKIDTSRVQFQQASANLQKGTGYLTLTGGILRGTTIGAAYQGNLYDQNGNIDMTGTFMPAYGLNRLFGELPLIGMLLGNGNDRGLLGVTFRLQGKASKPQLEVNPLSIIAPGVFRQIFEYR